MSREARRRFWEPEAVGSTPTCPNMPESIRTCVAPMVERRTPNPRVAGSNPAARDLDKINNSRKEFKKWQQKKH